MKKPSLFHVKKRTLLAVAGCVCILAGLVPDVFITVFYTGLGCALALAGILLNIGSFQMRLKQNSLS